MNNQSSTKIDSKGCKQCGDVNSNPERVNHNATTLEEGRSLAQTVVAQLGHKLSPWIASQTAITPWEYARLEIGAEVISVGISAGGVVSVNGDPFSPQSRLLNISLTNTRESIEHAINEIKRRLVGFI